MYLGEVAAATTPLVAYVDGDEDADVDTADIQEEEEADTHDMSMHLLRTPDTPVRGLARSGSPSGSLCSDYLLRKVSAGDMSLWATCQTMDRVAARMSCIREHRRCIPVEEVPGSSCMAHMLADPSAFRDTSHLIARFVRSSCACAYLWLRRA